MDASATNVLVAYVLIYVATCVLLLAKNSNNEGVRLDVGALTDGAAAIRQIDRRQQREEESTAASSKKTKCSDCDCDRARVCVYQDYLGHDSLFGRCFERVFCISRGTFERVWQIAATDDVFFQHHVIPVTQKATCPEVKVLMGLKQLAFGVPPIAFCNCFQMGETAGRSCMKRLCNVIARNVTLREKHLRKPTKADTMRISQLHVDECGGFPGNMGCLDCMHVHWKNCPRGWQGQFKNGKEEMSSLVLEAVSDYNAWFWHSFFGSPGANNDVNIWDQSPLLNSMLDGTLEACNFVFQIGDESFNKVWHMVDGIYPELTWFVKTCAVPMNRFQTDYAAWQEGNRKMIERAFGMLQRKFQALCRPVELFYMYDIADVVDTCLILHNMMVELRMERDEPEFLSIYDAVTLDENEQRDEERDAPERREEESAESNAAATGRVTTDGNDDRQAGVAARWNALSSNRQDEVHVQWELNFIDSDRHWDELYNEQEHHRLKHTLMKEIPKLKKTN